MDKGGTVYILTNKNKTVLYTGVTSNLITRILQHKEKDFPRSFTSRYNVFHLIYYETYDTIEAAISHEKEIKGKRRSWKEALINELNPKWKDLFDDIC